MDHADTAQLAAVLGALGAALVLLARTRSLLLAGFALLGCAEAGLIWSLSGEGGSDLAVGPLKLAAGAAGLVLLALGVAALVRWPATITPLVLAAAPSGCRSTSTPTRASFSRSRRAASSGGSYLSTASSALRAWP